MEGEIVHVAGPGLCTLLMATEIESCEFDIANGKLFRCYEAVSISARALLPSRIVEASHTWVESRLEDGDSVIL